MSAGTAIAKGNLTATSTAVDGVLVLEPKVFGDARGWFMETYNAASFGDVGIHQQFVQDNHSKSVQNVLRGLHYQTEHPQGKLVRVISGSVFDVAVDLRRRSPTFGKWMATQLSSENKRILWIPAGCAHGFLVLSAEAEVVYKTTDMYAPKSEFTILWNDPELGIEWPLQGPPILSEKDAKGKPFGSAPTFP